MQIRSRWIAASLGLALAGFAVIDPAQAAPVNRSGVISKFDGVDEIVNVCAAPAVFNNVPQMSRTFTISGAASAAVVTFSGSASLNGPTFATGFVRLTIDGAQQSPGEIPFISVGQSSEANSFTWQTKSLTVGSHTARIQWRTDLGATFCLDARSLVVLHR